MVKKLVNIRSSQVWRRIDLITVFKEKTPRAQRNNVRFRVQSWHRSTRQQERGRETGIQGKIKHFFLNTDWFREAFMELKTGFFLILKVLYYLTKKVL